MAVLRALREGRGELDALTEVVLERYFGHSEPVGPRQVAHLRRLLDATV